MWLCEQLHITLKQGMDLTEFEVRLWSQYFKVKQQKEKKSRGKN